ncbi:hypothetical protein Mapa_017517 [Marchantia paleacea]|nr:hypothetical protein Mapa_017517 [Marchantia paleacea]
MKMHRVLQQIVGNLGASQTHPVWSPVVRERNVFKGRKISDHVYDFREDRVKNPNSTIVFIHGLCLEDAQLQDAYFTTWMSKDSRTECWPSTLLADSFPRARLLTMKVDLSARQSDVYGRNELERLADNLVSEMITKSYEPIGQNQGPVIFVTHGLGAIVAQSFILAAVEKFRSIPSEEMCTDRTKLEAFLQNVRGLFYYSPIFAGSKQLEKVTRRHRNKSPSLKYVELLNFHSSRGVQEFQTLRSTSPFKDNIRTMAVGEENVTRQGPFSGMVVREGTSNIGVDDYVTVATDHFGVCQPEDVTSNNYIFLQTFVEHILELIPDKRNQELKASQHIYCSTSIREEIFPPLVDISRD